MTKRAMSGREGVSGRVGLTELSEEAADDELVEPACGWMGVELEGCAGSGCVLETVDPAAFLDVVGEVTACAVLHDEVDVGLCTDDVDETCDVSVLERLEDVDL